MIIEHGVILGDAATPDRSVWRAGPSNPWRESEQAAVLDTVGQGFCGHPWNALRRPTENAQLLRCELCGETLSAAPLMEAE